MREGRQNDLQPLVERYFAHPTPANLEAVVLAARPLVHSLIEKLTIPDNLLAAREDLENIGVLGLLQALNKYDLEHGTPFISYAYGRVRGSVIDFLRSIDVFSDRRRRQFGLAQHALVVLRQQQGREPPDQDVADYLGLTLKRYHGLLTDSKGRFPCLCMRMRRISSRCWKRFPTVTPWQRLIRLIAFRYKTMLRC